MGFSLRGLFSKKKSRRRKSGRKTVMAQRCDKLSNSECLARKKCKWVGKTRKFCRRKVNR